MKRILKRTLAVLMTLVMLIGIAPITGFDTIKAAAEEEAALPGYKTGDIIEFGSYPQSKVTDNSLITKLDAELKNWISYNYWSDDKPSDYMEYADFPFEKKQYRAVRFNKYRPYYTSNVASASYSSQDNNGYYIDTVYYFKFEPLKWRVLDIDEGLVMSEYLIDCQAYNNFIDFYGEYYGDESHKYYASNYAQSSLHEWLTNTFFNTAFNINQKNNIVQSEQSNNAYSTKFNEYDSPKTNDYIFLLSKDDATNEKYKFNSSFNANDDSRIGKGTDYAKCQGLGVHPIGGDSLWWLRTPGIGSDYACHVSYDGYAYSDQYTYALAGVRPAMRLKLSENPYVKEHIDVYESLNGTWSYFGFSNNCNEENIRSNANLSRIWDTLKDAGEVAALSFDELQITADYYDAYLGDLVLSFAEQQSEEGFKTKAFKYFSEGFDSIETLLDSDPDFSELPEVFDIKFAFDGSFELSAETQASLSKIFKNTYNKNPDLFQKVFNGAECADAVCDVFQAGINAYNSFCDCYNAYCITMAAKDMFSEFFEFCYDAADELAKTNPKFAGWFRNNIAKYEKNMPSDTELFLNAVSKTEYWVYDTFVKDLITGVTYEWVANVLGVSVAEIFSVIAAYRIGVVLSELIAYTDTESAYYIFYVYPVEKAMETVFSRYAADMKKQKTVDSAFKYETAFNTLKFTNINLYKKTFEYAASHRILLFKTKTMKENMEMATFYESCWKKFSCHFSDFTTDIKNYKTVGIHCPVDVYFYNGSNKLVLSVINEEIKTYADNSITVDVSDEHKGISYPADKDYRIEITARSHGKMNYNVMSVSGDSYRFVETYDIPLSANQKFSGTVPINHNAQTQQFELTTNGNKIKANYDSSKAVRSVSVSDLKLNYKKSATLNPTITADEGVTYTVKYESSNPKVAAVDGNGKVTAAKRGSGSATITCTVTDEYGNVVKDTCKVDVKLSFGQWLIVILLFGWIWY